MAGIIFPVYFTKNYLKDSLFNLFNGKLADNIAEHNLYWSTIFWYQLENAVFFFLYLRFILSEQLILGVFL
jgi:hypothetical protein